MMAIQEVEELERICPSEAEGSQELRADDFSRHELWESQSTVSQLIAQIQELQDRVNLSEWSKGVLWF